jgi:hypothetical protein
MKLHLWSDIKRKTMTVTDHSTIDYAELVKNAGLLALPAHFVTQQEQTFPFAVASRGGRSMHLRGRG